MAAQRRQHLVAAKGARALERTFTAYGDSELRRVEQFKYLGRLLSFDDNDTPVIRRNIKRARQVWGRISKVIAKDSVTRTCRVHVLPGSRRHGPTLRQ